MIANSARRVPDTRAIGFGALQQPGRGDVLEIEGGILTHEHRIEVAQRTNRLFPHRKPDGVGGRRQNALRARQYPAVAPDQRRALNGPDRVAARRCRAHHGDRGILMRRQAFQRIDDEGKLHQRIFLMRPARYAQVPAMPPTRQAARRRHRHRSDWAAHPDRDGNRAANSRFRRPAA